MEYHWLQFTILHRLTPTNLSLTELKLTDSKLCTFCKLETETIQHLIVDCPVVKEIWEAVEDMLLNRFVIPIALDKTSILFGKFNTCNMYLEFWILPTQPKVNGILKNIFPFYSFLSLFKNAIASMQTSVMLSSTLSIASANSSDVISVETWQYLLSFHHIFGLWDVLTMYISVIENNPEPNTSSVKDEPHTSSTGKLFFVLHINHSASWQCSTP